MSKEERAILLLNIYKEENSRLRRETLDRKIEIARQTADKEITPEESDLKIMEIEADRELEETRIEKRFLKAICALEG